MSDSPEYIDLSWNDDGQPFSSRFDDIYFSHHDGLEETRHVFLKGNKLPERFSQLNENQHFVIGETGFGTGLNFLATWQLWLQHAPHNARLHFISVEKYPLSPQSLEKASQLWPELSDISEPFIKAYRHSIVGKHLPAFIRLDFSQIQLTLILNDAASGLRQLCRHEHPQFSTPDWKGMDCWYLDGFAPRKNNDLWASTIFQTIAQLSHEETTFSTFTAARQVKDGLTAAGFKINKAKGYGKKRDMLTGIKGETTVTENSYSFKAKIKTPWQCHPSPKPLKRHQHVAVIGAGIAGCHTASALAKRGLRVTLIDKASNMANGASGNPQGLLFAKLSTSLGKLTEFNLHALLFAQQLLEAYWATCNPKSGGQQTGLLQLADKPDTRERYQSISAQFNNTHLLEFVDKEKASNLAGIPLIDPALYFPKSGWINPKFLCEWLTQSNNIQFLSNIHINNLRNTGGDRWKLDGTLRKTTWESDIFDSVVFANANSAAQLTEFNWLPTKPIRGQISYIPSSAEIGCLQTPLCNEGYISPLIQNENLNNDIESSRIQTLGASYNLGSDRISLSQQDHQENHQKVSSMAPFTSIAEPVDGRVSFRCTTPDYFPIAGYVPDAPQFNRVFKPLSKNARQFIAQPGCYHQGLYLNIGHGSRGLTYSPICAELIASQISGEPLPMPQSLIDNLNPARFLLRALIRK